MLCAPKRDERWAYFSIGGNGKEPTMTGLVSSLASTTQVSFGQSSPLGRVASSVTISRPRPKSGSTVCVKPGSGGGGNERSKKEIERGLAGSLTSNSSTPAGCSPGFWV